MTSPPGAWALDPAVAPPPDPSAEPAAFAVVVDPGDRIHFLDWGGPEPGPDRPGVLLIHGLSGTAWAWTPVARRLRALRRTLALDLRGHGLSDAPTAGYDPDTLAADALAVADGGGLVRGSGVVVAGHGFGAIVAAWTAVALADRCAGLVLVDGGWEDLAASTGQEPEEFLRGLDEPPEVLRSMRAYLADRRAFDPSTWDADQEHAAREAVVQLPAGRVVPVARPHAIAGAVEAMFDYRPADVLGAVAGPIVALVASPSGHDSASGEEAAGEATLAAVADALARAGRPAIRVARFPADGHNLPRYRPAEVTAAILAAGRPDGTRPPPAATMRP